MTTLSAQPQMPWQSDLSVDGGSPSVGHVTLRVSRTVVWIILSLLQILEQRIIYLHIVSSILQEPDIRCVKIMLYFKWLFPTLLFPACSSSFIHFFLISKNSASNLAFQLQKFSSVTGVLLGLFCFFFFLFLPGYTDMLFQGQRYYSWRQREAQILLQNSMQWLVEEHLIYIRCKTDTEGALTQLE